MKHIGLFAAGVLFGTAGLKILGSKDAKKVYAHTTAAVLRAKDCVMKAATTVREGAEDIYADAKDINEARLAALRVMIARHMNVAQSEAYVESLLCGRKTPVKPRRPSFIIKDVRLFLNSINHSMDVMRRAGVDAKCGREETEDTITLTIRIPKTKSAPVA